MPARLHDTSLLESGVFLDAKYSAVGKLIFIFWYAELRISNVIFKMANEFRSHGNRLGLLQVSSISIKSGHHTEIPDVFS